MKIRKKDRKINVDKIFIDNGKIGLVINGQYMEILTTYIYVNDIFEQLMTSLDLLYNDIDSYKLI